MKKVLVFENTVFEPALEKKLYHFCTLRQLSLIKYLIIYFTYSILCFFKILSREKYYEKRWSFLKDVKDIDDKINRFWKQQKKKLANISSDKNTVWISEYPQMLLKNLALQRGVELKANEYDTAAKTFSSFEDVCSLYKRVPAGQRHEIFDGYHSKLKKVENSDFMIVHNSKVFDSEKKFRTHKIVHMVYTFFVLLLLGTFLGFVSMYFGSAYFLMPMFFSYFKVNCLPFLNVFPVVLFIFLLYFISNRVWVSFLGTAVFTMALTWVNYFKVLIRNDPLFVSDLSLFLESMDMVGKYEIQLNWKIVCTVIACIAITVISAFIVREKIRLIRYRLVGTVLLVLVGVYSFNSIYMDSSIYAATENYNLINRWSATQVYISRGFLYPFIYSIKSSIVKPPEGYDEKLAEEKLYSYDYSDIPDNKKVNIISIMLEAYNDFSKFEQIEFNVDIYEYLHQLQTESYSGELVTNIFAGGTVDTERCFLTGYTSLYDFRKNINSYVRYFDEQGYTVEGSHPCYEWFYNRQNINKYLGFENYYYFENYYSELANGQIAKDNILFPQIIKLYEANKETDKPYFSFNVTYQNHGPYFSDKRTDVEYVKNKDYTEEGYNILNNYFSGIHSTNEELETFIEYFRKQEDPVVVILFGDHNPWLGDNNSVYKMLDINLDLGSEEGFYNYYNTPYIVWANDTAKEVLDNDFNGKGPVIGPYFLMNEFFGLAGYEGNEFMKFSNELREVIDVIHAKDRYKESGVLTAELSTQAQEKLTDFLRVQYYWEENFK